jgi:hypothetical protein
VSDVDELAAVKKSFPQITQLRIRKIGAFSLAKIFGLLYAILSLILVVILAIMTALSPARSFFLSSLYIVFLPILYGIVGFISGLVIAGVYNFIAIQMGGVEIEAE